MRQRSMAYERDDDARLEAPLRQGPHDSCSSDGLSWQKPVIHSEASCNVRPPISCQQPSRLDGAAPGKTGRHVAIILAVVEVYKFAVARVGCLKKFVLYFYDPGGTRQ